MDTKLQQLDKKINTNFQNIHTKLQQLDTEIEKVKTEVQQLYAKNDVMLQELDTKVFQKVDTILQGLDANVETTTTQPPKQANAHNVGLQKNHMQSDGFSCHEIIITNFKECQARGETRIWESIPISNTPNEHLFMLAVYTNAITGAQGTHLSVFLSKKHNKSKTEGTAVFYLLNQLGDHGHYIGREEKFSKEDEGIWLGDK